MPIVWGLLRPDRRGCENQCDDPGYDSKSFHDRLRHNFQDARSRRCAASPIE